MLELEDPVQIVNKFSKEKLGVLNDYIKMWTKTIDELLNKLQDTVPAPGMIGEIHYWRDLCRILEGITVELKLPEVELTVQIMVTWSEEKD